MDASIKTSSQSVCRRIGTFRARHRVRVMYLVVILVLSVDHSMARPGSGSKPTSPVINKGNHIINGGYHTINGGRFIVYGGRFRVHGGDFMVEGPNKEKLGNKLHGEDLVVKQAKQEESTGHEHDEKRDDVQHHQNHSSSGHSDSSSRSEDSSVGRSEYHPHHHRLKHSKHKGQSGGDSAVEGQIQINLNLNMKNVNAEGGSRDISRKNGRHGVPPRDSEMGETGWNRNDENDYEDNDDYGSDSDYSFEGSGGGGGGGGRGRGEGGGNRGRGSRDRDGAASGKGSKSQGNGGPNIRATCWFNNMPKREESVACDLRPELWGKDPPNLGDLYNLQSSFRYTDQALDIMASANITIANQTTGCVEELINYLPHTTWFTEKSTAEQINYLKQIGYLQSQLTTFGEDGQKLIDFWKTLDGYDENVVPDDIKLALLEQSFRMSKCLYDRLFAIDKVIIAIIIETAEPNSVSDANTVAARLGFMKWQVEGVKNVFIKDIWELVILQKAYFHRIGPQRLDYGLLDGWFA